MVSPTKDPRTGQWTNTVELLNRTPCEQWPALPINEATWEQLWAEDAIPMETPSLPHLYGVEV